jgi:hypothetical protein
MVKASEDREEGVDVGLRREQVRQDLHRRRQGPQVRHLHVSSVPHLLVSVL